MELRIAANEYPERIVTVEDVADAVDQALREVPQALIAALSNEDEDEQPGQSDWWDSYPEEHPYDTRWGIPIGDHPLPRISSPSSWWEN